MHANLAMSDMIKTALGGYKGVMKVNIREIILCCYA